MPELQKPATCVCGATQRLNHDQDLGVIDHWRVKCDICGRTSRWSLSLDDAESDWAADMRALTHFKSVKDALEWNVNCGCGVGKSGEEPSIQECADALQAGAHILDTLKEET